MAKKEKVEEFSLDFDDYEEKEGSTYDGEVPKRGIYDADLVSFRKHTSQDGNEGFEWIFELVGEPYAGWRGWVYSNMESTKWKTQQVVKAIQGGKEEKVVLKPMPEKSQNGGDSPTVKAASRVRVRLAREDFDDEPRAKIRRIMPAEDSASDSKKKKGKKGKSSEEPF